MSSCLPYISLIIALGASAPALAMPMSTNDGPSLLAIQEVGKSPSGPAQPGPYPPELGLPPQAEGPSPGPAPSSPGGVGYFMYPPGGQLPSGAMGPGELPGSFLSPEASNQVAHLFQQRSCGQPSSSAAYAQCQAAIWKIQQPEMEIGGSTEFQNVVNQMVRDTSFYNDAEGENCPPVHIHSTNNGPPIVTTNAIPEPRPIGVFAIPGVVAILYLMLF